VRDAERAAENRADAVLQSAPKQPQACKRGNSHHKFRYDFCRQLEIFHMSNAPSIAAALLAISATAAPALANDAKCAAAELQRSVAAGTTVREASIVPAKDAVPAHCLVKATVTTEGNNVDFHLALPASWNGKFYFQGVGGFGGSMGRLGAGLERGYASATTDTGHQGTATDARWALNDRAKEIDYGHRGTHVTTVAAKQVTAAYYGSAPRYAYFSGCSNGGRQALMEAQRYPDDYDGIVAGNPSLGALGNVRRALTYQYLLAAPDRALTPEKLAVLSNAAVAACDKNDGLADGLIGDPRGCSFDPAVVSCKAIDGPDCLSAGQVAMAKFIYAETKLPDGRRIAGFPIGHEDGTTGWQQWITGRAPPTSQEGGALSFGAEPPIGFRFADGFFRYMAFEKDDPEYDWLKNFDVARDLPKIETYSRLISPTDPDLSAFRKSGGKLLLYHGWADPALSAYDTINYYGSVVAKNGGKRRADQFVRLFLAPGMHHCAGGPGPNTFDSLSALERWVESGAAPERIIASHVTGEKVDRTRPLCPEPQVARYVGSGSVDSAENFQCGAAR
jgi:hypothetical protein